MIDRTAHFGDAPASPSPQLGREVVIDGDSVFLGPFGDVPIEAWKVDHDDSIDFVVAEDVFGLIGQAEELAKLGKDFGDSHDGHAGQVKVALQTGVEHASAAETSEPSVRRMVPHASHQVRCMKIPAGFADGEEPARRGIEHLGLGHLGLGQIGLGLVGCHGMDNLLAAAKCAWTEKPDLACAPLPIRSKTWDIRENGGVRQYEGCLINWERELFRERFHTQEWLAFPTRGIETYYF